MSIETEEELAGNCRVNSEIPEEDYNGSLLCVSMYMKETSSKCYDK